VSLLKDLWGFLRERKKWWLLPMIIVLLIFSTLIVLTSGSAVAPFIYTLF
jgi:competence protein ComGC